MLATIGNLLLFLFVLGLAILVHELGHFLAARYWKIKVEEFAIGFGPKLWGRMWRGTLFSIRAIPLGGFNKILGEAEQVKSKDSFSERPFFWQKFTVLIAGVCMNILLAFVLFYAFLGIVGWHWEIALPKNYGDVQPIAGDVQKDNRVIITAILESSEIDSQYAEDLPMVVAKYNGEAIHSIEQLQQNIKATGPNQTATLEYYAQGVPEQKRTIQVSTNADSLLGIGIDEATWIDIKYNNSVWATATSGVSHSINMVYMNFKILGELIGESVEEQSVAPVGNSVYGVVGFYKVLDITFATDGVSGLLSLAAIFNLSLAIMNLLPIPALDGGHILIGIVESIRRKRFKEETVGIINLLGFVFVIILGVVITVKDVNQFGVWQNITDWVKNIIPGN